MKHNEVWRALDTLAEEHGLSPSGLAKRAGLDSTTFNPSKRTMPDGRARWPSTESVAKALDATNVTNIAAVLFMWTTLPAFGAASYVPAIVLERALFVR